MNNTPAEGETPTRQRLRELLQPVVNAIGDVERLGRFSPAVDPVRYVLQLAEPIREALAILDSEASDTVAAAPQPKTCANAIDRLEQWSAETRGSWRLTRVTNEAHALAPLGVGFGLELMTVDGTRVFEKSGKGRPLETAVAAAFKKVGYALPESKGHAPRRTEP